MKLDYENIAFCRFSEKVVLSLSIYDVVSIINIKTNCLLKDFLEVHKNTLHADILYNQQKTNAIIIFS